jgi:hypothetical protein
MLWEKQNVLRIMTFEKVIPIGYKFVKNSQEYDLVIRRVGGKAGHVFLSKLLKESTNYFLKFENQDSLDFVLINSPLPIIEKDYVIGPRSISKPELIACINKLLESRL